MLTLDDLTRTPNPLAAYYSRFRVRERILLTGHSHQAWPDHALEGQEQAWLDAAELTDEKWERAFRVADRVRKGYAELLGDETGDIALAGNTHELLVRLLSALPLRERPRLVTTDGEFHSIRRQLDRLAEEGLEIVKVPAEPLDSLAERLAAEADDRTAAVLASSVFFRDARIVHGLETTMHACEKVGATFVVDAYHHLNVVPFSIREMGLERAFVVGGGYKYCQSGEGNAFLRIPAGCKLRPVITGWFSEFSAVTQEGSAGGVVYGKGADRFAGATYDPTSHYRAAAVFDFFKEMELSAERLRAVSQSQLRTLAKAFDALDADPEIIDRDRETDLVEFGGFLSLKTPYAGELERELRERGVHTDHREDRLRLGPAPYLSTKQLEDGIAALGECLQEL